MDVLRTIRNYFFYSGIEKDKYNAVTALYRSKADQESSFSIYE